MHNATTDDAGAVQTAQAAQTEPKPASKNASKSKGKGGKSKHAKKGGKPSKKVLTARTADRHVLYQHSVQNVEAEIDFVDERFEIIRSRKAVTLREDFCGTGNTSCEWVRRRETNRAVGLDIDANPLDWGREHNFAKLDDDQRSRVALLERDVREPGDAVGMDCILAMNFSYWLFQTRDAMRGYFESVRNSLGDEGIFFLDFYGGSESMTETKENRKVSMPGTTGFTYVWEQKTYNPITGEMECRIHFKFPDKSRMDDAFTYTWRLWTLPEIRELLTEAGFKNVTVYWEGDDGDGEGNGEFEPATVGDADPAFICYITGEK